MKKTVIFIVMAALCLNFGNIASAQTPENKAVDITAKGIKVGQKVPDNPIFSKYKGKLIILDFWATWCSPCVAMIPKIEALQAQFSDQIQIIPVTYQAEKEVIPFLKKLYKGKPSVLPQITGDKELYKLFPHTAIPHYVWIDSDGIVGAITGLQELTAENVYKMIKQTGLSLMRKKDMYLKYDKYSPFLVRGNGGTDFPLIYHSMLSRYHEGIGHGFTFINSRDSSIRKVSARNLTIPRLFQLAYSAEKSTQDGFFSNNRVILEVKDSSALYFKGSVAARKEWVKDNTFCYELMIPTAKGTELFPMMRQELNRWFDGYLVDVEKRKVKCLVLTRVSPADKIKSSGGKPRVIFSSMKAELKNQSLDVLIAHLTVEYLQNSPLPIINGTGYSGKTDLEISASLSNVQDINAALKRYDLRFDEAFRVIDMLVIRDAKIMGKAK